MTLRQAWVFWCDAEDCTEKVMSFMKLKQDAINCAVKSGWTINRLTPISSECYCPIHSKKDDE